MPSTHSFSPDIHSQLLPPQGGETYLPAHSHGGRTELRADTPTCRDLAVCFYVTVWCFCLFEASVVYILLQQERRKDGLNDFGVFLSLKTNLKILQKPAEVKILFNMLFKNYFCSKSRIHFSFTSQEKGTKLQAIRPLRSTVFSQRF